jgi:Formate/nitrite family of transporters
LPWKDFWLVFAGPTLAGNIIGGSFIFALISHAQIRSESKAPSATHSGAREQLSQSKKKA